MLKINRVQIKNQTTFFLIASFFLCIININATIIKAESNLPINAGSENISVSAVIDQYLAVYKQSDGGVIAETNTGNKYLADSSICVINY